MKTNEFTPKVRPYTNEERDELFLIGRDSKEDRYKHLKTRVGFDVARYKEATNAHPEMQEHFSKLIECANSSLVSWARYYNSTSDHAEVAQQVQITIPYDGTESPTTTTVAHVPNPEREHLPA